MGALHSYYNLYRLRKRLSWPKAKLDEFRYEKLIQLLSYCYENIPYYRDQFKNIGAKPEDFRSFDDLVHFPILDKETLRDRPEEFIDPGADRSTWIRYSSSGSTGIPLELWYHPSERKRMGFTMTREFQHHGLKVWHRMANLTEPRHFEPRNRWYHRLGIMNERFLSIFDKPEDNLDILRKVDPHLLIGFPTILMVIGRKMMEENLPPLRPRFLFTLAEVLTPEYRKILNEQWGVNPIDIYGANEVGHIAVQCSARDNYHINNDSVHVEIIKNNKPAEMGERGEVVVTNFDLRVMPILRYRVGDVSHKVDSSCSCGSSLPMLGPVAGRSDGFIVGADGKFFSALEASLLLHPIKGIRHYRLIQKKQGHIVVEWVEKDSNSSPQDEIKKVLHDTFGETTEIDIVKVAEIRRERSGKIRSVISEISSPFRMNP